MAYCTLSDLEAKISEAKLIRLTDDAGTGSVDTEITDRAIADADAEINPYCAGQYKIPLDPVPDIIRKFSVDITLYNLYQRRDGAPEERYRDYKNAIAFLQNIASGKASLGEQPEPEAPEEASNQASQVATRPKMFGPLFIDRY